MNPAVVLLSAVTAERLAELWWARRNTAALLAQGASEFAAGHYPAIVLLHSLWLSSLWIFGWGRPIGLGWLAVAHYAAGINNLFDVIAAGSVIYGVMTIASVALSPRWGRRRGV